jgi:hypothetical protein
MVKTVLTQRIPAPEALLAQRGSHLQALNHLNPAVDPLLMRPADLQKLFNLWRRFAQFKAVLSVEQIRTHLAIFSS